MVTPSKLSGARARRRPQEPTGRPTRSARLAILLVALALGTAGACAPDGPTAVPAVPAPGATAPPHVGMDGSFVRVSPSLWAQGTRYVFAEDGTFRLNYPSYSVPGRYTRADSVLTLSFPGSGVFLAGPNRAILRGDTLTVTYNEAMGREGFEDGAYVRTP